MNTEFVSLNTNTVFSLKTLNEAKMKSHARVINNYIFCNETNTFIFL